MLRRLQILKIELGITTPDEIKEERRAAASKNRTWHQKEKKKKRGN